MTITNKKEDRKKTKQLLIPLYKVHLNKHQKINKSLHLKELKLAATE
jgi:hypothetical protein